METLIQKKYLFKKAIEETLAQLGQGLVTMKAKGWEKHCATFIIDTMEFIQT